MHLNILVSDLDGTLAHHGHVEPETWHALRAAKAAGITLVLNTGRILATFAPDGPFAELFDAIVAEDGAVVYFPRSDMVLLPFGHLPGALLSRIEALQLPIERGMALIATHVPHDRPILELLRQIGGGATVEYNRGAVMVLPVGATKGSGLDVALRELGRSLRNTIVVGDAENDRSMFAVAECAAAVANATPDLLQAADVILSEPEGAGVRQLIDDLCAGRQPPRRVRLDRQLQLGQHLDGSVCTIDPWLLVDGAAGIAGDSHSGKSWLSGLLAEALIAQGYQVLIIDPEGDYRAMASLPHTMLVGASDTHLRRVGDVTTICEFAQCNLVVDLSELPTGERAGYCERLLRELHELRMRRGRPHWILIDEIQQLCPPGGGSLGALVQLMLHEGGIAIVSHRPSQVDPRLLRAVSLWALTRLSAEEELVQLDRILDGCEAWHSTRARLPQLVRGQAQLCACRSERANRPALEESIIFRAGMRQVPHIRHLHKYMRTPLPREKWFVFRTPDGRECGAAANLTEFRAMIAQAPVESLALHLQNADFERWTTDIIHDGELSRQIRKVLRHHPHTSELRAALQAAVDVRYEELTALL